MKFNRRLQPGAFKRAAKLFSDLRMHACCECVCACTNLFGIFLVTHMTYQLFYCLTIDT